MSAQKSIITAKLRKKLLCESPRRHSTTNQRSSLAHIFFGATSPFGSRDENQTSHLTILASSRKPSRDRDILQNRRAHFADVPIDSRRSHDFNSDGESDDSKQMFYAHDRPMEMRRRKFGSSHLPLLLSSPSSSSLSYPSNAHTAPHCSPKMRKVMRVVVVGAKKVGKTAILRQLTYYQDVSAVAYMPTIDDTYQIQTHVDADERPKELMIFHDTAGVMDFGPLELKRPYVQVADAFLLAYSVLDHESFNRMDQLKKFIDRQFGKEKKEVPIVVIGTMIDLPGRQVDRELAMHWAAREKVKLFEVSARDRSSLLDVVHYLSGRYFHPLKEPKFSITKRLKPEKTNAQIVMDF